jgi:hypothetical protein
MARVTSCFAGAESETAMVSPSILALAGTNFSVFARDQEPGQRHFLGSQTFFGRPKAQPDGDGS